MATINNQHKKSFTLWPYAIVGSMALFMSYIVFFVYKAMNQDVNLVSQNYYEQEIAYQDHINTVGRTIAVGEVAISYNPENQAVLLQLPEDFTGKAITGSINLFRPSNEKLDQQLPIQLGRDMSQLIETNELEKGLWKVRVSFSAGDEAYYSEKTIQVK